MSEDFAAKSLRSLPAIGIALESDAFASLIERYSRSRVRTALRHVLDATRARLLRGDAVDTDLPSLVEEVSRAIDAPPSYRRVVNATGVVLHTGLGRAPLSDRATAALSTGSTGALRLEFDLDTGQRGKRDAGCRDLLVQLTGAEDATVVNNNAGATLLAVAALGRGRDVIVSRGELVEIGGSYRLPTIIEESGSILREIGTTNRTHLADYENAMGPETAALLKVHRSNFGVVGFTKEVDLPALVEIGDARGVPVIHDVGAGFFEAHPHWDDEPSLLQSIKDGAALVLASGDKLIGGPQAGLIFGKRDAVARCRSHPLFRALRPGRLTYAALEATLQSHVDGTATEELPALARLSRDVSELTDEASHLATAMNELEGVTARVVETTSAVGSGAGALRELPSRGVEFEIAGRSARDVDTALRALSLPVVARVRDGRILVDVRSLFDEDAARVVSAIQEVIESGKEPQ